MIEVIDDYLPEDLFKQIQQKYGPTAYMKYGWKQGDNDPHGHWNINIADPCGGSGKCLYDIESNISAEAKKVWNIFRGNTEDVLVRCYVNGHTYGIDGYFHYDASFGDEEQTTLVIYLNEEWKKDWYGSTIFMDKNDEIIKAVSPKRNRAVIFSSHILHAASPLARQFMGIRSCLVIKKRKRRDDNFEKITSFLKDIEAHLFRLDRNYLHEHLITVYQILKVKNISQDICFAGGLYSVIDNLKVNEQKIIDIFGRKVYDIVSLFSVLDYPKTLENPNNVSDGLVTLMSKNGILVVDEDTFKNLRAIQCGILIEQQKLTENNFPNLYKFGRQL